MSARAMSTNFFSSLSNKRPDPSGRPPCKGVAIGAPLCIRVLRNRAPATGWEKRGWSGTHSHFHAQFTSLITPNISIERPGAHLADGPRQGVAALLWPNTGRAYAVLHTRFIAQRRFFFNLICTRTTGTASPGKPGRAVQAVMMINCTF